MAAELTQIHGRVRRWQFTAGVLRVVLVLPPGIATGCCWSPSVG